MGKFEDSTTIVLALFATTYWVETGIITQPTNFTGNLNIDTYIRVSVIQSNTDGVYGNVSGLRGQIIIDIFTPAGDGPVAAQQIADKLDGLLVGKLQSSASGRVQTGLSSLIVFGIDKANPSLYRNIYTVSFNYFGN